MWCFWLVETSSWNPGCMGSIFWLGFACERICGFSVRTSLRLNNFVSAWLLLHVYGLVDVLDFVIVLVQNDVFEYMLVYSACGGAVVHICKTYLCFWLVETSSWNPGCMGSIFWLGVCERICCLSVRTSSRFENFVSAWSLLHVYVLVDALDFVIVLFQTGVFEYMLVYSGWGGGLLCIDANEFVCTPKKLLRGAKNEVARDVWEFQRSPSRLLSSMVKCILIPEDKHAITNFDKYGL